VSDSKSDPPADGSAKRGIDHVFDLLIWSIVLLFGSTDTGPGHHIPCRCTNRQANAQSNRATLTAQRTRKFYLHIKLANRPGRN
jgi:hypothetical protein